DVHRMAVALRFPHADLFPPRGDQAVVLEDLLHAAVEDEPEVVDAGETVRLQVRLHRRRALPDTVGDFIAAHADVPPRPPRRAGPPVSRGSATRAPTTRSMKRYVDSSTGFITLSW